jgi:hypothetical protein
MNLTDVRRLPILAAIAALTLAATHGFAQRDPFADLQPTVIVVSFDGFRWDYPSKAPTPNLRRLMERGVQARNLVPSFPSKTFPNHYSIVTGLYPGITGSLPTTSLIRQRVGHSPRQSARNCAIRCGGAERRSGRWWSAPEGSRRPSSGPALRRRTQG